MIHVSRALGWFFSCMLLSVCIGISAHDQCVFRVESASVQTLPFAVCGIGQSDDSVLSGLVENVSYCLAYSGQFDIHKSFRKHRPKNKSSVAAYAKSGALFVLFLKSNDTRGTDVSWWLYDANSGELVKAQHCTLGVEHVRQVGHCIAAVLWPLLVTQKAPFSSSLSYIQKEFATERKARVVRSELYVADFDGAHRRALVSVPSILVAPSWAGSAAYPYLFYSEFTPSNVRVKAVNMQGRSKSVFDVDGTSVGVCATTDGTVVYCRSGTIWRCEFNRETKRTTHTALIKRDSPCACPVVCDNGDVVYCYKSGIWLYDVRTKKHTRLTKRRGCVGPAYCSLGDKIAYASRTDGIMQIYVYDMAKKTHVQVTKGPADKTDPCWSPDGQYIAYTCVRPGSSCVMTKNIATGVTHRVSPVGVWCEGPTWSYPRITFA